jgi:multimeric flavodoxin WrbA
LYDQVLASSGIMLASPIFFYTVSAHTKIFMDRCQSLWVKKHWLEKRNHVQEESKRKALFISVGATKGKKLFDGVLLSIRYFLDALDATLHQTLVYRGLDFEGEVLKHPEYLDEAYRAGERLSQALRDT